MQNKEDNLQGDKLITLPVNNSEKINEQDEQLLNLLLEDKKEQIKEAKKISFVFKESILGGLLFLALSHPFFDNLVRLTGCKSELTILFMKFAVFVILFFILQNKFLVKK
jgi:hypothetical protein